MTDTRVEFIRSSLEAHYGLSQKSSAPLAGLRVIDVGCGGGLLTVPLARLGANVLGVDASTANVATAQAHVGDSGEDFPGTIEYRAVTAGVSVCVSVCACACACGHQRDPPRARGAHHVPMMMNVYLVCCCRGTRGSRGALRCGVLF